MIVCAFQCMAIIFSVLKILRCITGRIFSSMLYSVTTYWWRQSYIWQSSHRSHKPRCYIDFLTISAVGCCLFSGIDLWRPAQKKAVTCQIFWLTLNFWLVIFMTYTNDKLPLSQINLRRGVCARTVKKTWLDYPCIVTAPMQLLHCLCCALLSKHWSPREVGLW